MGEKPDPGTKKTGKRKRGHTSCAKFKSTGDENWAKKHPRLTESLEVRKQDSAVGKGLFVRKSFKKGFEKGDAIGEYVGERILEDEYQARIEEYIMDKTFNYFVGVTDGLYIDAAKRGNWTRFVNNSHEPNAQFEPLVVSGTWRVYLVATERIRAGDEVTIDYGSEYRCPDQKFVKCICSSKRCSGVIGVTLDKESISTLLLRDIHYQDDDLNILCAENRLLESQNRQLQQQITQIQSLLLERVKSTFEQVFTPVIDRRAQDVIESNGRVVQDLIGQSQLAVEHAADSSSDLISNVGDGSTMAVASSPLPAITTPVASGSKVKAISNSRRSSARLTANSNSSSNSIKRPAEDESEDSDYESAQITPPPKKKKQSLSVHNMPDCTIESSISEPKSPSNKYNKTVPIPSKVLSASSSKHEVATTAISIEDDESDDDIIEVSPIQSRSVPVCALPAPTPASPNRSTNRLTRSPAFTPSSSSACTTPASSATDRKAPDLHVVPYTGPKSKMAQLVTDLIDWYKKLSSSRRDDFGSHNCPVHTDDPFTSLRDVRKHFFLKHVGAANAYRQQLEASGGCLTEREAKIFAEGATATSHDYGIKN